MPRELASVCSLMDKKATSFGLRGGKALEKGGLKRRATLEVFFAGKHCRMYVVSKQH